MYSILQSLCCCNGQGSDDGGPLINDIDGDHFGTNTPCDSTNSFWMNDADRHMTSHTTSSPNISRQVNDEDELLNQILEATQQNIIDVANMDGTTAPYKEDLSKAQRYSDAIRQHDLLVRKAPHAFHSIHATQADARLSSSSAITDLFLLFDVGPRVIELLQQPAQAFTVHSDLRDFAGNMSAAMVNGIQIQHKQDVLIHMTFSDE